jgi:anionic cell wall polymer biosynthesis LytR-Cps2A-Psr (LCP) family protein
MWTFLALIGVGLVGWTIASVGSGEGDPGPSPTATSTVVAEQRTLLIQVRNDSDNGADNMIVAVDGGRPASQVLVPSRLMVDVPASGQQTLGRTARLLGRSASQDALSDLLALRIDGTLSLARLALAGMVDFVGGVTVDVDREIVAQDERTGEDIVVVARGRQSLNGTQAAAYALAWLPGEPESARLARFSTVITETVKALPEDSLRVEQMLTSLGGSARTTTSTEAVADFLLLMRQSILAGEQQVQELPTTSDAGGGLSVVRAELDAADALLRRLAPDAVLDRAEATPRVVVSNGVGKAGVAAAARDRIVREGLVYINGGNAEKLGRARTRVLVREAGDRELGEQVADALDVPARSVQLAGEGSMVVDVAVVLGRDFEP